jgi:hypothetical protein
VIEIIICWFPHAITGEVYKLSIDTYAALEADEAEMDEIIAFGAERGVYLIPHNESTPHYQNMIDSMSHDYCAGDSFAGFPDVQPLIRIIMNKTEIKSAFRGWMPPIPMKKNISCTTSWLTCCSHYLWSLLNQPSVPNGTYLRGF